MSFTERFTEFVYGVLTCYGSGNNDDLRADIRDFGIQHCIRHQLWLNRADWEDLARWYLNRKKVARIHRWTRSA